MDADRKFYYSLKITCKLELKDEFIARSRGEIGKFSVQNNTFERFKRGNENL
ncbi:MAG: hypothetical protein ACTSRA_16710 [Promethearchaeota archaeon]